MSATTAPVPSEEDAFNSIVAYLRAGCPARFPNYGYELYMPNAMRFYLAEGGTRDAGAGDLTRISPAFYDAAWELCRRGILRPGVSEYGGQATEEGSAGNGYSVTPFGRRWLEESGDHAYVPTEPGRFAELLESAGQRFGDGFRQRAQEAVRCYGAHAYLACCAMSGAAAESILLALAIAKTGDEQAVIREYFSRGGRGRVQNRILGQAARTIQDEFRAYSSPLKYWRDNTAHGQALDISDNEAYTSLGLLLRLAYFASDHWDELTA